MSRQARKHTVSPNMIYHVVSRGNNRNKIFRNIGDYKKFLEIIKETKKEMRFYLYSYNLLPNHYHLKIETVDIPISKIMHRINFLYVKYFHRRYQTSGHLFQGRFYSSLINKESYFFQVACYIDLNAVRAGLVKNPEDYRWSSYSVYCQTNYDGELIDCDMFLRHKGEDLEKSRLAYLKFVEESLKFKKEPDGIIKTTMV